MSKIALDCVILNLHFKFYKLPEDEYNLKGILLHPRPSRWGCCLPRVFRCSTLKQVRRVRPCYNISSALAERPRDSSCLHVS